MEYRSTDRNAVGAAPRGKYDLIVVGGGLIGLATARALLMRHRDLRLVVVEKERELAAHQSGRNSGVVHAGLYYAAGSLKAQLCREGREALLRFAEERGIPYRVCGKLVVAVDWRELPRLEELRRRGSANGLRGLRELGPREIREIEPHAVGVRALYVPETAVIDFRAVTRAYADDVLALGGELATGHEVVGVWSDGRRSSVYLQSEERLDARAVVACAGVQSDRVAALSGKRPHERRIAPFRGDFFVLSERARALVRALIYPVPDPTFPFLGVHFTRRIDGEVWAGPNAVPALAREGYGRLSVDLRDARELLGFPGFWRLARRYAATGATEIWRDVVKRSAVKAMRRYVPELDGGDVEFGPAGVRAQVLLRDGTLVDDFVLERNDRILHVVNAPSPAATASLAIGLRLASEISDLVAAA
jgi:L-2-hydroxyglutarate oxidase LhgO